MAGGICLSLVVAFVPPLRAAVLEARDAVAAATAAAREADTRKARTARFALRFRVSIPLAEQIEAAAVAEGIDPELAFRLVRVESGFRDRAVSSAGALGLTQLMPATARSLQAGLSEEQIFERETNLRLGFRYLRWLLDVYDGDLSEALHAYNRGPGTVERVRRAGGDPANGYADRVLGTGTRDPYRGDGLLPAAHRLRSPPAAR